MSDEKITDVRDLFGTEFRAWWEGDHGTVYLVFEDEERNGEPVCCVYWRDDRFSLEADPRSWKQLDEGAACLSGNLLRIATEYGYDTILELDCLGAPRREGDPGSACWVTGDLHGELPETCRLADHRWPAAETLTERDYAIVCGDFGYVWCGGVVDDVNLDWFAERPWTTLFVDGNHENHELLSSYPVERWHGGLTHVIRPNVRHLMRGQVFDDIAGARVLAMGGASSHDREWREEGVSWWPEELPNEKDFAECRRNLDACGWKVDYVVTHEAPADVADRLCEQKGREFDAANGGDCHQRFLQELYDRLDYRHWYFGHYHANCDIADAREMTLIYGRVIRLGEHFEEVA